MKELTVDINLDEEVTHLAEFIRQKWTPIANIEALFTDIRDAALHAARGWFDQHEIWEFAVKLEDQRAAMLKKTLSDDLDVGLEYYDALCTLLSSVSRDAQPVRDAALAVDGNWDFSRVTSRLTSRLLETYPDLAPSRPLGWAELEKDYNDFDGQEAYDPRPDRELFTGSHVPGLQSPAFPGRVALPYVMYDEKCQGLKARGALVGAVFAHFLGIAEYLNTLELKTAIEKAFSGIHTPELLFERHVETDNKLLKVLIALARPSPSKEDFEKAVVAKAKFEALSEDEKEDSKAVNNRKVIELLERLRSERNDEKWEAEKQHRITLMREAFAN